MEHRKATRGDRRAPTWPKVGSTRTFFPGGLAAAVAVGGASLSGGQRLRLAVATPCWAKAILADEPTAKLDPATAASIRICLRDVTAGWCSSPAMTGTSSRWPTR